MWSENFSADKPRLLLILHPRPLCFLSVMLGVDLDDFVEWKPYVCCILGSIPAAFHPDHSLPHFTVWQRPDANTFTEVLVDLDLAKSEVWVKQQLE